MYLAGYIERMGTDTGDIIRLCKEAGLRPPEFIEEDIFKVVFWRKAAPVTGEVGEPVKQLLSILDGEMKNPN